MIMTGMAFDALRPFDLASLASWRFNFFHPPLASWRFILMEQV